MGNVTLLSGYDLTSAKVQKARWNYWTVYANETTLDKADFTGSVLTNLWLGGASARYTKFVTVKFKNLATTSSTDFSYADFTNAKFSWDNLLPGVAIKDALEGVNFTGAIFRGVNLTAEDLSLAILTGATMPDGSIHP